MTLQQLAFSLNDIGSLLDVRVDSPVSCDELAGHARAKLAVVEDKLATLEQVRDALVEVTRTCCAPTHDSRSCARLQPSPIGEPER